MKKLRSVAAASMVALSAFSAHALTFNLGTIGVAPGAPLGHSSIAGPFTDTYTFSLAAHSLVSADATSNATLIAPGYSVGEIINFSASIDATPLSLSTTITSLGPGFSQQVQQLLTSPPISLASGIHTLTISGTGTTLGAASYSGNIFATHVPEPESYVMMLAGLGALGFLARRRRS